MKFQRNIDFAKLEESIDEIEINQDLVITVSRDTLDDWDFVQELNKLISNENDLQALDNVLTRILGAKQFKEVLKYLKKKYGKARTSSLMQIVSVIFEVLQKNDDSKN